MWKGGASTVKAGFTSDFVLAVPKGMSNRVKAEMVSRQPLLAPVTAGQAVGTMRVTASTTNPSVNIHLRSKAFVAGVLGRMIDTVRLWFN